MKRRIPSPSPRTHTHTQTHTRVKKKELRERNVEKSVLGPSSFVLSSPSLERFPRRVQQRELASTTVLKTLTNLRYKRRLSCDLNVGTSQPQLKSARSAMFDRRKTIEDTSRFQTFPAPCLETLAGSPRAREDTAAEFSTELTQYTEMDVDSNNTGAGRSDPDTGDVL